MTLAGLIIGRSISRSHLGAPLRNHQCHSPPATAEILEARSGGDPGQHPSLLARTEIDRWHRQLEVDCDSDRAGESKSTVALHERALSIALGCCAGHTVKQLSSMHDELAGNPSGSSKGLCNASARVDEVRARIN